MLARFIYCFLIHHFHFPATRGRFYPQRSPGQAVVQPWSQGVYPSPPPVRAFIFLSRTGFSIPTARRFSSNAANSRSRDFPLIIVYARKGRYEHALVKTRTHVIELDSHADHPLRFILIGERFFHSFQSLELIGGVCQYTEAFCHYS